MSSPSNAAASSGEGRRDSPRAGSSPNRDTQRRGSSPNIPIERCSPSKLRLPSSSSSSTWTMVGHCIPGPVFDIGSEQEFPSLPARAPTPEQDLPARAPSPQQELAARDPTPEQESPARAPTQHDHSSDDDDDDVDVFQGSVKFALR